MVVNDNAGNLIPRGVLPSIASMLAPTEIHAVPVGASKLAMVVNDNAGSLTPRGVRSSLARVVNDNAGCLTPRGVRSSIASMLAPTEIRRCL